MSKKGKRSKKQRPWLAAWARRQRGRLRFLAIAGALVGVAYAVWLIAGPSEPPTAIDENGQEVKAGVLDEPGARARAGSPAPNFVLPDYEQRAVRLDQFEGKLVFVNFWASWCVFCEREMGDIMRMARRFPDDVVVIAINRGESKNTAEAWTGAHDFPDLPNVHWLLDTRESVVDEYRVEGMPQSFLIDRGGGVRDEFRRVIDYDIITTAVESALGRAASSGEG